MEGSSKSGTVVVVAANERKPSGGIRIGNPFTLKVGQVFTGFGIGCGVGIGVGRPINLGAVPVVNQVMGATRGATDAFSGVSRHVTDALRKVGAKNIEAGIGCGVGFGHGFGVGLALKPGILQQIQFLAVQTMTKMMTKFGIAPNSPILQGAVPSSLQSGIGIMNDSSSQNSVGNIMQMATKPPDYATQGLPGYGNKGTGSTYDNFPSTSSPVDTPFGSRTEKVLSSFLQSPVLKGEESEVAGRLSSENKILQMVLKHQQVIDELTEENEKLRHILVEDLKVPPSKLQAHYTSKIKYPCSDCFECRRKQRRR
ncbi:hypothetical protein RchiOBHm_Chr7g0205091 [Rosa chinensis]|uniref:Uncharacterized protein n=1 Tax=Rosa chinensis TaxID=74649 RepID=A0A2P6P8U6_ROSCH|nr:uncharacterized protein LOC112180938 isoform X1 [Rosa chinensis]PRQ18354.1 hypothetical protein RchiOBHm_Chr7g0205091 [Rosa chinensis]